MKKILIVIVVLSSILITPNLAKAQGSLVSVGYRMAFPVLDFSKYIGATSFRGVQFDYKYFVNDNLAVGFQFHWNGFYENKARTTYDVPNTGTSITAEQFNFTYQNSLLVGADYYIPTNVIVKPYIGARLGSAYLEIDRFIGPIQFQDTKWRFSYSINAGTLIQIPNTSLAFTLEGSWNQVTYKNMHYNHLSNVGLSIGFCYSGQFENL